MQPSEELKLKILGFARPVPGTGLEAPAESKYPNREARA